MFKKIISLLLIVFLLFAVGCTKPDTKTNKKPAVQNNNKGQEDIVADNKNKIKGELELGTDFTNGLAFVKLKGDEKNYCIDKKGNILFELNGIIFKIDGSVYPKQAETTGFYNDIALISDFSKINFITVCDINGKLTSAEELGVSYFLDDAFKDGYILTVTEGTKSKDDKLGVLNSKLEWVVEPSSDIVKSLGMNYGVDRSSKLYYDYVLYGANASVNIKSGEISSETYRDKGTEIYASNVEFWSPRDNGYIDGNGEVVIDIYNNPNITNFGNSTVKVDGAGLVNGKAPILFSNNTDWIRFSLIDIEGNLLFNPITFGENIDYIQIDGDHLFVVGNQNYHSTTAKMYDLKGDLIGELDTSIISTTTQYNMQNGVVRVSYGIFSVDGSEKIMWVKYFNTDLKPLF